MDLGITGKIALVTGAGRGIGRGIAVRLSQEGARLILVGRSPEALIQLSQDLAGAGERSREFSLDLMDETAVEDMVQRVLQECGPPDILVHNVGGSLGVTDALASSADWAKVWHFNVGIGHQLNRAFIPAMKAKGWGRVVHVSSVSADNLSGYPAYASAKAALNAYVKILGRNVARDNIVVSAVAPGPIYAEGRYLARLQQENPEAIDEFYRHHLAIGRLGTAEEIAAAAAFLCSTHASFAVGSIFGVDGGSM